MERFGVESPRHLLLEIDAALAVLRTSKGTTFRNLFFVLAGLNHLRDWIAPSAAEKLRKRKELTTPGELFYERIHRESSEWGVVNDLCNGLKHFRQDRYATSDNASNLLSDWHSMEGVTSLAIGHPQRFTVEGMDILPILEATRNFYVEHWFGQD
jgi:hypothetical protein